MIKTDSVIAYFKYATFVHAQGQVCVCVGGDKRLDNGQAQSTVHIEKLLPQELVTKALE